MLMTLTITSHYPFLPLSLAASTGKMHVQPKGTGMPPQNVFLLQSLQVLWLCYDHHDEVSADDDDDGWLGLLLPLAAIVRFLSMSPSVVDLIFYHHYQYSTVIATMSSFSLSTTAIIIFASNSCSSNLSPAAYTLYTSKSSTQTRHSNP